MPVVHANGIDIHYRITGEGGETVVLVNGVGDDLEGWAMQVDPLVAAGLRVITFDNRGVGRSSLPPGPYSSREMAADTKALADALGLSHSTSSVSPWAASSPRNMRWPIPAISARSCSRTRTPGPMRTRGPPSTPGGRSPKQEGCR